jgi:hypothetical protein
MECWNAGILEKWVWENRIVEYGPSVVMKVKLK